MTDKYGDEYKAAKKAWMDDDGWYHLDAMLEGKGNQYEKQRDDNKLIFEQTDAIMNTGHFNTALALPVFRISQLMHHRILSVDATTDDEQGKFAKKYFDRMAYARDLLLAAAILLDGEHDPDKVAADIIRGLQARIDGKAQRDA